MLNPTLSGAVINMGDENSTSPFTGIEPSHGFPRNLLLFSVVFIRTGVVLQKCISNSIDSSEKKNTEPAYFLFLKFNFLKC